jgi:hypothetical protein
MLLRADGTVEDFPTADGGPVSLAMGERRAHRMSFNAGDAVLLFTDGLIERRTEDIDTGRSRLAESLGALADADLDHGLRVTVGEVGDVTHDDDVAAVALRRRAR